jgi:alpha-glucosidase
VRTGGAELGRDGCRVPLPWTDEVSTSFGFSPGGASDPWLPPPKEWGRWNAATQASDSDSMLALYRRALELRRAEPDLTSAAFEMLLPDDPALVAYRRGGIVVVLNMSEHERAVPDDLVEGLRVLLASLGDLTSAGSLGPNSAVWFGP